MKQGIIIKGIGGFYSVTYQGNVYVCKAAGALRNKKIKPVCGDRVLFDEEKHGDYLIEDILPRDNYIIRPPAANVTKSVIVCAIKTPQIDWLLLDKLLIDSKICNTEIILCMSKCDLANEDEIKFITDNYSEVIDNIVFTSSVNDEGIDELKNLLSGSVSLMRGVSGAGKTSLLNKLCPDEFRETGELSRKIQRGKNTTRHTELIMIDDDSYILDTPGFSDFELRDIDEENLWKHYPEFYEYSECKYMNCVHMNEPECGIKNAVEEGKISSLRYDNYKKLYEEIKKKKKY